ncbi:hypothetical protein E6H33_00120 [Candidatus Bathyarchaeota archaeon]|nr:MAG: hypothetical protein E6H33_00120 [Candidatus Bathyarchaeota archaeon]
MTGCVKPPSADEVRESMTPVWGADPFVTVIVRVDTCPGLRLVVLGNTVTWRLGAGTPRAYTL